MRFRQVPSSFDCDLVLLNYVCLEFFKLQISTYLRFTCILITLDKQTKEKVIENYRYINVEDTFWYDFIKEDFIRLGLEIRSFDLDRGSFAEIHIADLLHGCS